MVQASACRSQNCRISPTAALAADIASLAFTDVLGAGSQPTLGSKTRTKPSQNAIFKRKRMNGACFPAACLAACEQTLAGKLEGRVRSVSRFFSIFKANTPHFFRKFE